MGMGPNNIKMLRTRRGLSQLDLASEAGMTVETVSRIENDRGPMPRATSVRKLAGALGVEALDLWATPQDAQAAVEAVADGRVQVEGEEPRETRTAPQEVREAGTVREEPDGVSEAPPATPGTAAPTTSNGAPAQPAIAPRQHEPPVPAADREASRDAAARAYGVDGSPPPPEPETAPRRGIELPSPPPGVADEARQAVREQLFAQLPDDADEADQIETGIDTIAQWVFDNSGDGSVPAPILRWLTFAWLARIIAPETIQAGAHDPVDRSDVTNPPRKLLVAYDQADQMIERRIEAEETA